MRLFVYGKTSDDKGHQLEALMAAILKNMGYDNVTLNERGSGGNEIDVTATKKEPIGDDTTLICECKAYKSLVDMTDWLKFVGKVYLMHRKDSRAHGLMVALSGANGFVMGNYNEIKNDKFITLITNEDIYNYVIKIHPMLPEKDVIKIVGQYTRKNVVGVNIIYYDCTFFWLICFPSGQYTILNNDLSNVEGEQLEAFKNMVESDTDSRLYVNIAEEYEANLRKSLIRSLILSYTLDKKHLINEIVKWINTFKPDLEITETEVSEGVENIPFLVKSDNEEVSVIPKREYDIIELYRFILKDTISTRIMRTKFYKNNINKTLLKKICKVQGGIRIPEDRIDDCLFLFKHSPSALAYAITPDEAILRLRGNSRTFSERIDRGHTEWFLDNVMRGFIKDYNTQELHEYYLDIEKIGSIEIHTNLKIFKDGQNPKEMHLFKAECLGHLGSEYNNQTILMVKLPE